ncbi:hypothetical protein ES708_21514 [subsurface metagenome]
MNIGYICYSSFKLVKQVCITWFTNLGNLCDTWFGNIKLLAKDWFPNIREVFETKWEEVHNFITNPFKYLRDIVFPLLGEMIGALAEGLITYVKDKWGDEK